MSDLEKKKAEIAKMNPGDSFLNKNGKTYVFESYVRGFIIGRFGDGRFKIPAESFERIVQTGADPELAKVTRDAQAKQEATRETLKKLGLGDTVRCNDGNLYTFIKLNRTKFLGKLGEDTYDIPISMFVELVEKAKTDPALEAKKKRIRTFFGKEIGTCYGPSIVKGFTPEEDSVILYEFGEERYHLKLDDFLSQIEEYN